MARLCSAMLPARWRDRSSPPELRQGGRRRGRSGDACSRVATMVRTMNLGCDTGTTDGTHQGTLRPLHGPAAARARMEGMDTIGVVDTMFARYDMGGEALDALKQCPGYGTTFTTIRRTVPGFKDLAVAAKKLIEEEGCRIIV